MKFAHIADVHLGGWKEPKIRELNSLAWTTAVGRCISQKVDFVLISGDLFNTSMPPIESLKTAVSELKRLKDSGIPVYSIAGSHDFSPSGKTMLEVLEEADLVKNVCRGKIIDGKLNLGFTIDKKTGAKITGMLGKKGMLEKSYYEDLATGSLENESGFKIFLFHTAIAELKPEELEKMDAAPLSLLPKGFDYYAGGHVHIIREENIDGYKNLIYPGPLFPNSFSELEKLRSGGFYIYENGKTIYERIELCKISTISIDCNHKSPEQVTQDIVESISKSDVRDAIVLMRLFGTLEQGKTSEINLQKISEILHEKGAFYVMKNTGNLGSKEFSSVTVKADNTEDAEKLVIDENIGQVKTMQLSKDEEKELIRQLMTALDIEKEEGEKQHDYEARVISQLEKMF